MKGMWYNKVLGLIILTAWPSASFASAPLDFAKDVLPILERSCLPCHNATKSEGDLMLETPQLMLKGGEKGPSINPNHAMDSLLYLTAARQKKPFMPPAENKSKALPLTSQQLEILRRWIDEGAIGKGKVKEPVKWQSMPPVARISASAITRDGAFAAASRGNRVTLYDLPLKQAVAELPGDAHRDLINAVAFSPDGTLLATGSYGEVKIWKLVTFGIKPVQASVTEHAQVDEKKVLASLKGDSEQNAKIADASLHQQEATFEFAYQKDAQQKAADALKKFEESAKKAASENADLIKRKDEIAKAVVDAMKKRDDLLKDKEAAETALAHASEAKEKADKALEDAERALKESDAKTREATTKALAAAKTTAAAATKAQTEADKKQKDVVSKANEAQKTVNEAQSETGKAVDAALSARKTAEDLVQGRKELEAAGKLVTSAQATLDKTNKSLEALRKGTPVMSPVHGVAFSEDRQLIVTAHEDGCVRGWQAATGEGRWTRRIDKQPLTALALQDGQWLVTKTSGETVALDLRPRFELVRTIGDSTKVDSPLTDRVNALAYSPDGKVLATGSGDPSRSGEIKLWDLASGNLLRAFTKPHKDAVLALDFSADGKQLASGAADRAVRLWEVATGRQLRNLEAHSGHVLSVSLRHDNRMLASAGADNAVRTWSLLTGDVVKTIGDFKKEVTSVHYAEQRNLLLATAGDPQVRAFTDEGGTVRSDDKTTASFLTTGCVTPDGRTFLAGDAAGSLWVLGADGKVLASFPAVK